MGAGLIFISHVKSSIEAEKTKDLTALTSSYEKQVDVIGEEQARMKEASRREGVSQQKHSAITMSRTFAKIEPLAFMSQS